MAFFPIPISVHEVKVLSGVRIRLVVSLRKEHGTNSVEIWVGAQGST